MATTSPRTPGAASGEPPILRLVDLRKSFALRSRTADGQIEYVRAVDGVTLEIRRGEALAVVGESGCGKSTTARMLVLLSEPDEGRIELRGQPIGQADGISERAYRQAVQMVFQDSYASLNPRMTLEQAVAFGLRVNGVSRGEAASRAREALARVGLDPALFATRYPHELSGGQRQRVNIARALAMRPEVVILDEAVSALDKSVEAQVLNLLHDLRRALGLTYVFITHDLNVVEHIADRVAVMYLGRIVETGSVRQVFESPRHPYTRGLLHSRLSMDPDQRIDTPPLSGDPPNPINPPSGCGFRTRCPLALPVCATTRPDLTATGSGDQSVACHAERPNAGTAR